MSFADLAKQNMRFVVQTAAAETVAYRAHGKSQWAEIPARVQRARDEFGNFLANTITIVVDRTAVPNPSEGHDLFSRLVEKVPGQVWPVYRLTRIVEQGNPGSYHLICVQ